MQSAVFKKAISFILVFSIIFSVGFIPPKKAVAQANMAGCLISGLASLIGALGGIEVPTKDYGQNLKDQCMDALFYVMNEIVLKKITADTVNWINSGFDGNPAFVENPEKFFSDIADQEVGRFLESSELSFLCSPFQLEIKKALIKSNSKQKFQEEVTCRLSEVTENIENFIAGDFTDGGWEAWRTLATDNPYSNYVEASMELRFRQLGKVETKKMDMEIGKGFLSYEECTETGTIDMGRDIGDIGEEGSFEDEENKEEKQKLTVSDCKTVTPGSVINDQLNHTLGSGQRRIEAADEINEIVDALIAHYLNEVLTKGLRNMSKKDSSGKSYNDNVSDSATTTRSN